MSLPLSRRRLGALAAGVALAPLAAAAQSPPPGPALEKIEVLLDWKGLPTYAGFHIAREMGAFERRGIDVSFREVLGANVSIEEIGAGKTAWIGTSSGMATAIGRARGLPVKSLAVYYRKTPSVIFTRAEDRSAHPRDLYGKRLGIVAGSITNEELRALFAINRLDLGKVEVVPVEWDTFALLEKKVDALIDYEEMTPAEMLSDGRRLLLLRMSDFGVRTYSLNLVVNDTAWASPQRQALARKVAEAVAEAYTMVAERPADAAATFANIFPRLAPRYIDRSMGIVARQLGQPPIGVQTRAGWQETLDLLSSLKLLPKPVTVDDVAIFD